MSFIYTEDQEKAIKHRGGNLLIIACAGSGKTEVISKRIAELVKEGVSRDEIIAFTFTERAAEELKKRIRDHLEKTQPDDPSLGDMYVGTIHSFCLQLLKEVDFEYRNYEVMDEIRRAALIASNFYKLGLGEFYKRTGERYRIIIEKFINTLDVMHYKRMTPQDLKDPLLRRAVEKYNNLSTCHPNYFLDYNKIIDELIRYLENHPEKLEEQRARFKHLVVDEYQDVDPRQEELIRLLTDGGTRVDLTVVGDDDQSIYGWRGADISNILKFKERYPNVTQVNLKYNFRSTHAIVELANAAASRIKSDPPRLSKNMEARHLVGKVFRERMAERGDIQKREFASERDEALWIKDRIEELKGVIIEDKNGPRALHYSDMAILVRANSHSPIIAEVLRDYGIPVVVEGTRGLFKQPEIIVVQAAFYLLAGKKLYVENENRWGQGKLLGEGDLRELIRKKIRELKKRIPLADANSFLGWISTKKRILENKTGSGRIYPQEIFQEMLVELGCVKGEEPWPDDILYNMGRFSILIKEFESVHQWITYNRLEDFCMFLGNWASGKIDDGKKETIAKPKAVQIMTIHAAKGLEWPVVFIPRVSGSDFPSKRRNEGIDTYIPKSDFDPKEFATGDVGERRLWYVALTRCRKFLNISAINKHRKRPSVYFKEIVHDYVVEDGNDPTQRERGEPQWSSDTDLFPTTFSDINCYWRCPYEYLLRCLMGFSPGVKESYGYGQQIHNILYEIHDRMSRGKVPSVDTVEELVEEKFHLRYTREGPLENLKKAAKDSIVRYVENYGDRADLVFKAEKPFEFIDKKSGALISGTIDLLERCVELDGDEKRVPVCVVDFKTNRIEDHRDHDEVMRTVEKQLRLYAAAVRNALGFDPRSAEVHFIRPADELEQKGIQERTSVDVSEENQINVLKQVGQAIEGIRNEKFPMSGCEKGLCSKCDFERICFGAQNKRRQ